MIQKDLHNGLTIINNKTSFIFQNSLFSVYALVTCLMGHCQPRSEGRHEVYRSDTFTPISNEELTKSVMC